jgi:hypothetical protein
MVMMVLTYTHSRLSELQTQNSNNLHDEDNRDHVAPMYDPNPTRNYESRKPVEGNDTLESNFSNIRLAKNSNTYQAPRYMTNTTTSSTKRSTATKQTKETEFNYADDHSPAHMNSSSHGWAR